MMSNKMTVSEDDQPQECPLCMEILEADDLFFFPCTCGYQICLFCWHRIRTDENGLCPACRKPYPENPAGFKALSIEEFQQIKNNKRQKEIQKKQKLSESRKHLQSLRVVQKNLVFVVGLPSRLADPEILKKQEYFGKYGKIHKVVVNSSTTYAGSQGPSSSAYVTYNKPEDALKAIEAVNNLVVDGRTLKASLGTTKYCSFFLKHHQCLKTDCMYLHEIGDEAASFTKEEMQQGKHLEYEKRLHEQMVQNEKAHSDPNSESSSLNNSSDGFPSHKTQRQKGSQNSTDKKSNYKRKAKKEVKSTASEPIPLSEKGGSNKQHTHTSKERYHPSSPRAGNSTSGESHHTVAESITKESPTSQRLEERRPPCSDPVELSSSHCHRPRRLSHDSGSSPPTSPSSSSPFLTPIGSLTDRHQPPTTPPPYLNASRQVGGNQLSPPLPSTISSTSNHVETSSLSSKSPSPPQISDWSVPESSIIPPTSISSPSGSQQEKEDELGFDPCNESTRALAEMVQKEAALKQEIIRNPFPQAQGANHLVTSLDGPLMYKNPTQIENGPIQRTLPNPPPGFTGTPPVSINGMIHSPSLFKDHFSSEHLIPRSNNILLTAHHRQQMEGGPSLYHSSLPTHSSILPPHLSPPPLQQQPAMMTGSSHLSQMSARQQEEQFRKLLPNVKISFSPSLSQSENSMLASPRGKDVTWANHDSSILSAGNFTAVASQSRENLLKLQQLQLDERVGVHPNHHFPSPALYKTWNYPQQMPPPGFSSIPFKYTTEARNGVQSPLSRSLPPQPFIYPLVERPFTNQ